MIGIQMLGNGKLSKVEAQTVFEGFDAVKVKVTKVLMTADDISVICDNDSNINYPLFAGRMAVGQITEVMGQDLSDSPDSDKKMSEGYELAWGDFVYLASVISCDNCYHCQSNKRDMCYNFEEPGKNTNGFLSDFVVAKRKNVFKLPKSVKPEDAVYIEYISLALSTFDKLDIQKGQHLAIIGGGVLGSILAQVAIYYQAVPILIDKNQDNLERAKKCGIYYPLLADSEVAEKVSNITGGRMVHKIVYISHSKIDTDIALKLASPNATIGFVGFSSDNLRLSIKPAMQKQIDIKTVINGVGNEESAINLLANNAVDLSNFKLKTIKFSEVMPVLESIVEKYQNNEDFDYLLIDMMQL